MMGDAAAAAACEAVAVTASGSVEYTMPLGQAANEKADEPAAEAGEEAAKLSASVGAAQETVASAAGAKAVQEAVESPAGSAHAASGAGPFRQAADSVIEASMSSAAKGVASGGNSLHPPQQQALVQAFTQALVQRAMVADTLLTSTAPEHVTAAVLSALNKVLNTDDLQRGSAASEHHLAAVEASVASAKSAACPAADLRGTAGSASDLRGTAGSAADLRGTAGSAAASATAAQSPNSDGTAAIAAPASATLRSAPESGSTAAHLTSADETADASTVDAALDVSKPSSDETAMVSTVDAAMNVSKPTSDETAIVSTVDAAMNVSKPTSDETAVVPTVHAAVDVPNPSAPDAAMLDALHHAGAGPAKLQLMGQDDLPRLVGSGAFSAWHGYVFIDFCTLCMILNRCTASSVCAHCHGTFSYQNVGSV